MATQIETTVFGEPTQTLHENLEEGNTEREPENLTEFSLRRG
jgi:hypothetical protein